MLTPEFIKEMQGRLEAEQQRLTAELAGLSPHTEMGDNYGDGAVEFEADSVNQDLIAQIKGDLAKIEAALARITAGTYGIAEDGREISEARLRAIPWADTAI